MLYKWKYKVCNQFWLAFCTQYNSLETHLGCCINTVLLGLPWWLTGKESACQCRGHGFGPCSRKIPHAAEQLSPWNTTTESACCKTEACVPRACALQREAVAMRSLCTTSSPCSKQLEKSHAKQQRPSTAKNKYFPPFWLQRMISRYRYITVCLSSNLSKDIWLFPVWGYH